MGEQVALGVRPEDLRLASYDDPVQPGFDVVVESSRSSGPRFCWM